jgi:cell division septal protein FtsQ
MKHVARNRTIAIVVLLIAGLTYLFAWSPVFQVRSIEVTGLPKGITSSFVTAQAEIVYGEKLARLEPRAISNRLAKLSWIESSDIGRNWINGKVSIALTVRTPVGIYHGRALDSKGNLFDFPGKRPQGLPQVSATSTTTGLKAIDLFAALPEDIRAALSSMTATSDSSIVTRVNVGARVIAVQWGGADQLSLKVKVYRALLALPENAKATSIDLSAPHAPIVK